MKKEIVMSINNSSSVYINIKHMLCGYHPVCDMYRTFGILALASQN